MKCKTVSWPLALAFILFVIATAGVGCHRKQPVQPSPDLPQNNPPPVPPVTVPIARVPAVANPAAPMTVTVVVPPPDEQKIVDSHFIVAIWKQMITANEAAKYVDADGAIRFSMLKFANLIAAIDCTHCPLDFQDAFARLVKSATELGTRDQALVFTSGFLDDAARSDAQVQRNSQIEDYQRQLIECKRVAAQHGVTFPTK